VLHRPFAACERLLVFLRLLLRLLQSQVMRELAHGHLVTVLQRSG
jgi:hypothetical protein